MADRSCPECGDTVMDVAPEYSEAAYYVCTCGWHGDARDAQADTIPPGARPIPLVRRMALADAKALARSGSSPKSFARVADRDWPELPPREREAIVSIAWRGFR